MKKSTRTRVTYLGMFLVTAFVAWLLSNWATVILPFVPVLQHLPMHVGGASAVTRVMGAVAVFHLVMAVVLAGVRTGKDPRAFVQDGFWVVKAGVLALLVFAFFQIPNQGLGALGWIAFSGATVFIVIQIILLIAFSKSWNESWFAKWDAAEPNGWYVAHVGATAGMYLFVFAVSIAMYAVYVSQCPLNSLFITVNILACVANSFISFLPAVRARTPSSGALQAGTISAYATYLVFSAIFSEDSSCSYSSSAPPPATAHSAASLSSLLFGVVFTIASVCYSAIRVSMSEADLESLVTGEAADEHVVLLDDYYAGVLEDDAAADADANADADPEAAAAARAKKADAAADKEAAADAAAAAAAEDDEADACAYNYSFFHITFALASLYMCMLLTNWMVLSHAPASASGLKVNSGSAAIWVKVITSWVTHALYAWSLLAPVLFPFREFDL